MIATAEVPQIEEKVEKPTLPLPRWSEQELKTFRNSLPSPDSLGTLLPANGEPSTDINELLNTPVADAPRLDRYFPSPDGELSPRLKSEDMRLFLPESILGLPTQSAVSTMRLPTPESSLRDVSSEFMAACSRFLPKEYLIDPDLLVPEMQNHDMTSFLEFHAKDARIKLYVLTIPHDRKLPEGARLDSIASGRLLQTDACLLVYPLAEPWRARLFVSKSVHNQTSTAFLSETLQSCLHEALQTSDSYDQLHRYAIHLSTRLFWLQRALGADPAIKTDTGLPLAEVAPDLMAPDAQKSSHIVVIWAFAILSSIGILGIAARHIRYRLRLRTRNLVWLLPEPDDTIPRLEGAFTGGGGGMIRYA
ncbi:hypothetical protein [Prosthecobacter sp.]|uniref:hypothetical protein n=1 Tax=Prosthecobacter sp. TaxID=1965333 RepID=UPI001DE2A169|nr:hypothetical protein [Prosthecobacter sp.]MCB1275915.1 hypothetical protein [Prosthecobacter sp.]